MGQTRRLGTTATSVRRDGHVTHVRYHETDVVSFSPTQITLRTGGWKAVTTKLRMNQASRQFNLGYNVYQVKGQWYVRYKGLIPEPFSSTGVHVLERTTS